MAIGNFGQCGGCGCRILWIRTKAGKNMPCNPTMLNYRKEPGGKEKIVTQDGEVVSGITGVSPEEADGIGYTSHFATCTQAKRFRRRG
ncbi:hypothetical protein IMSAGC019_01560 [Lachnospiraceae bacterium]|nr:hypothetical protein IMSAGC019_01560 [Lachnospiraceae bacterium]